MSFITQLIFIDNFHGTVAAINHCITRATGSKGMNMNTLINEYIVHTMIGAAVVCFGVSLTVNAATMGEIILNAVLAIQGVK